MVSSLQLLQLVKCSARPSLLSAPESIVSSPASSWLRFFFSRRYTRECAAFRSFRSPGNEFFEGCIWPKGAKVRTGRHRAEAAASDDVLSSDEIDPRLRTLLVVLWALPSAFQNSLKFKPHSKCSKFYKRRRVPAALCTLAS